MGRKLPKWIIGLLAHNQKVVSSNLVQAVTCFPCLPAAREVKQGCSLRTYAFKIMRGLKRTWMTKQKSRGPETVRSRRHAQTPQNKRQFHDRDSKNQKQDMLVEELKDTVK